MAELPLGEPWCGFPSSTTIPDFLELMTEVLAALGHEACPVLAADASPSTLNALRPDLIVIDVGIGDSTAAAASLALVRACRADPPTANVPIVICTGDVVFLRESAELAEIPDVRFLPKPFSIADVDGAISRTPAPH